MENYETNSVPKLRNDGRQARKKTIRSEKRAPRLPTLPALDFRKKVVSIVTTIVSLIGTALIWSQLIRVYYLAFSGLPEFKQQMSEQLQLSVLLMVSLLSLMIIWQEFRQVNTDNEKTRPSVITIQDISSLYSMSPEEVAKIQNMPIVHLDKVQYSVDENDSSLEKIKITDDSYNMPIYIKSPEQI